MTETLETLAPDAFVSDSDDVTVTREHYEALFRDLRAEHETMTTERDTARAEATHVRETLNSYREAYDETSRNLFAANDATRQAEANLDGERAAHAATAALVDTDTVTLLASAEIVARFASLRDHAARKLGENTRADFDRILLAHDAFTVTPTDPDLARRVAAMVADKIDAIVTDMHEHADEAGWCSDYDSVMQQHGFATRESEWRITWSREVTVTETGTSYVTAATVDAARDIASSEDVEWERDDYNDDRPRSPYIDDIQRND